MYKILIADERALRVLVRGTLEIGDYEIIETDNGLDALRLAKQEKPNLIILDVMMPGMTGYEVCKNIKDDPDTSDMKVLILTAKGQQQDKEAAWDVKADYYLAKPFSPMKLLSLIEGIINKTRG